MIGAKQKWITVGILAIIILLAAAFDLGYENKNITSPDIETVNEFENISLGGVAGRMPENSAKILFESLLGVKLKAYRSYDNIDETLSALRSNEIQGAWFADITADYLLKTQKGFQKIEVPGATMPRLEFGIALKKGQEELCSQINAALEEIKAAGILKDLNDTYIDKADSAEPLYQSDNNFQSTNGTLTIGVTGAVWPIDMLDVKGNPYGYSVALMDQIGSHLNKRITFVRLSNDTAFSSLMGGKVDALFCYGTSDNTLTDSKNYIMTEGYATMNQYSYLVLE